MPLLNSTAVRRCHVAKPGLDRWIDRYAARVRLGEFLQRAAETGAAFLFGFGSGVLLDRIHEEKVLDEQEKEQLKEEIAKIAEETRATPLTHEKWETVDALRERMKVRLESAVMVAAQASEAAALLSESNSADADSELS